MVKKKVKKKKVAKKKKKNLNANKRYHNNPWIIGITVGIISGIITGILVGAVFLYREQRIVRELRLTHIRFADKSLKEGLDEEALRLYDDILKKLPDKDMYLYAYIRNQTARAYLSLAKKGIEKKRNLIRSAVAFEECLRVSGSESWRESIFAELELSGIYWSLSWFQDTEANIAKSIGFFEDVLELYPGLRYTTPFPLSGISPGDDLFRGDPNFPVTQKDIKKSIRHGEETLKICTIEKYPIAYGLVQFNLGFYHMKLANLEDNTAYFNESIRAFKEALKIFIPEEYPLNYIDLNINISLAYLYLSDVNNEGKNMRCALVMLEKALSIATFEDHPNRYAQVNEVLSYVYLKLSSVEEEEGNMIKAISICKNALKVHEQDKTTYEYGSVLGRLGFLYLQLSKIKNKDLHIENSADFLERAINVIKIYNRDIATLDSANVQDRLGQLYLFLSEIKDEENNIKNSVDSFYKALDLLDSEKYPLEYKRVRLMLQNAKNKRKTDKKVEKEVETAID